MPLATFQKPKFLGGFGLTNIRTKTLSFKWKLFQRYRLEESPFRDFMFSSLAVFSTKKKLPLQLKKVPSYAPDFAKDLINASKLLKPIYTVKTIDSLFMEKSICQLPPLAFLQGEQTEDPPCGVLAARMQNSLLPFEELREGQRQLAAHFPNLQFGSVWKKRKAFQKLRSAPRAFLIKLFNAGVYLPHDCPTCESSIQTCSTVHFLTCPTVVDTMMQLCPNVSLQDFITSPADTMKKEPTFPLALYATYCVAMDIVHQNGDAHVDFVPRVKLKLNMELLRRDYPFH